MVTHGMYLEQPVHRDRKQNGDWEGLEERKMRSFFVHAEFPFYKVKSSGDGLCSNVNVF